jgi:hypothetical protein
LDNFITDYEEWEKTNLHECGLFWSIDDRDGGEYSISGNGLRPTINSYMYGCASVIAKVSMLAGELAIHEKLSVFNLVNERLNTWDADCLDTQIIDMFQSIAFLYAANCHLSKKFRKELGIKVVFFLKQIMY